MFRRGCHDTTLIQVARRYIGNRRVPACIPMASHAKDCHISRRQSRTEDSWTLAGDEKAWAKMCDGGVAEATADGRAPHSRRRFPARETPPRNSEVMTASASGLHFAKMLLGD